MYDNYYKEFFKLFDNLSRLHDRYQVFYDLMKISCISIQNVFLKNEDLENDYKNTIKKYSQSEIELFQKLFGTLVMMFETRNKIVDILGHIYNKLNIADKGLGQVFTPEHIADFMAKVTFDEEQTQNQIKENGFITLNEPACGAGIMIIAAAATLKEYNINYQKHLLVIATDISALCVYMTYLQASLYGIPAIIQCGNTLTMTTKFTLTTPLFHMNYWRFQKNSNKKESIPDEINTNEIIQNTSYTFKETVKNGNAQISFW